MRYLILIIALLSAGVTQAGTYSESLGRCLVASTSQSDKTALVRWLFAVSALHPEVASISAVADADRERMNRRTAALIQRLMTESCRRETQEAIRHEGAAVAVQSSFGLLGEIAMRELISHPRVTAGFESYAQYLDAEKLQALGLE